MLLITDCDGLFSDVTNEMKELTEHGLRLTFSIFFVELEEKLGSTCFMKVTSLYSCFVKWMVPLDYSLNIYF